MTPGPNRPKWIHGCAGPATKHGGGGVPRAIRCPCPGRGAGKGSTVEEGCPGEDSSLAEVPRGRAVAATCTVVSMTRQNPASKSGARRLAKVVAYVVHKSRLLVFTHDDIALELAGVQVPAGTIEPGEAPAAAAVREVLEETGLSTRVVADLGGERYDVRPSRAEVHERHFFQLELLDPDPPERWAAGETHPSGGGVGARWTCWWLPLQHAHVLCAGFGARVGLLPGNDELD